MVLSLSPTRAAATTFASCWVTEVITPFGSVEQVTRCRIAGGEIVDYASDADVPSRLYPQTGTDLTGQCWYYTSAVTRYVILTQYANGDADIGFDIDPSTPGGIVAIGPRFPRCTSEPTPTTDPTAEVWSYVMQYIHDPPTPSLSPSPGDGVTGLTTFVGVPVPTDHSATLGAGGVTLEVFIEVSAVVVEWGDGEIDSYPADGRALSGYPDGIAGHVYEKKDTGIFLSVAYDWTARWRVGGGSWVFLAVPDTSTVVPYPVGEIVSDLTG